MINARGDVFVPLGPGSCEEAKRGVLQFLKEAEEIVSASDSPRFPLGESFLVAKGIRLTSEELGLPPLLPSREAFFQKFLRGSDDAIRLAAQSSECWVLRFSALPCRPQGSAAPLSQAGGLLGKKRQSGFVSQSKLERCALLQNAASPTGGRPPALVLL